MARVSSRTKARKKTPRGAGRRPKFVYAFSGGKAEGSSALRPLRGGKGSEPDEMTNLGAPVPPGSTIPTEAWAAYSANDRPSPAGFWEQVQAAMARLEGAAGLRFGD